MRYTELALSAQTAYAELLEQTRTLELTNALAGLVGSFHKLTRKGQDYWYFAYRDLGQKVRMAYVGPEIGDRPRFPKCVETVVCPLLPSLSSPSISYRYKLAISAT